MSGLRRKLEGEGKVDLHCVIVNLALSSIIVYLFVSFLSEFASLCLFTNLADEATSPVVSPVASALNSPDDSPVVSPVKNPKALGLSEEAVPMVMVQQFIQDNKEKGLPSNQKVADLKRKKEAIAAERKKVALQLLNEERKRRRLKSRAKQLSAEDLVQVLAIRATTAFATQATTTDATGSSSRPTP